jgi:hypothetical protein
MPLNVPGCNLFRLLYDTNNIVTGTYYGGRSVAPVPVIPPSHDLRKLFSSSRSVNWPSNIPIMDIGGSRRSCGGRAHVSTTNEYSGSGSWKGCNFPAGNPGNVAVVPEEK